MDTRHRRNERGRQLTTELAAQSSQFKLRGTNQTFEDPTPEAKHFFVPKPALYLDYTAYVMPGRHVLEFVALTADGNSPTYTALATAASQRRAESFHGPAPAVGSEWILESHCEQQSDGNQNAADPDRSQVSQCGVQGGGGNDRICGCADV